MARWLARSLLALTSVAAATAVAEWSVRRFGEALIGPAPGALQVPADAPEWAGLDEARLRNRVTDPDFGVRPPVGSDGRDEFGALANDYPREKTAGVERVLLVGDSVVERDLFRRALREAYAESDTEREWWNTGVSGFGTAQELLWYERYGRQIGADHVVLLFHPNDFSATPIVYQDERGRLVTFQPHRPALRPNAWLLRHSHLYRAWLHFRLRGDDPEGIVEDVRDSLRRWAQLVEGDGARFSVVLLPVFTADPSEVDPTVRTRALELFTELDLRFFDLLPALQRVLDEGIDPQQSPGDHEHPSLAACHVFAAELLEAGLL